MTSVIYLAITEKADLKVLIKNFIKKGGKINKYYLANPKKGPSLVFYKRWYRGKNVQDAITRALASQ